MPLPPSHQGPPVHRIPRRSFALLACLLAACSGSGGPAEVVVRDSAGVTIVEHPAGAIASAPAWTLGAPSVSIGGGDGEDQGFSFLAFAHRLGDGRIVLADNENAGTRLLVYGPDGTFERRVGRTGDGPGEFRNARVLGARGDTLVIYDFMTARVTRMNAAGVLLGTAELSRLGPLKVGMVSGVLADGRLLTSPLSFGDTTDHGSAPFRQDGSALAIDPATATLDTLQAFPGNEVTMVKMDFGGMSRSMPGPIGYGKRTLYATQASQVHVATNATAEIATFGLPWALHRIVRFSDPTPRVDQAAHDAQIAEAVANIENASGTPEPFKASMIAAVQRVAFADSMAHYASMLPGADGSLWLRQMRSVADSVPHYLVLGADGRLAARIDLPKGARLMWTDGAEALVVMTDASDLPRLELRPVIKGTPAT